MFTFAPTLIASLLALSSIQSVAGHGLLTAVQGANGVTGQPFGVDPSTPRNGATPTPFEQDTSVIRDSEIASGKTDVCGRTKLGGVNDVAAQMAAASSAGLPSMAADGTITMTLHQVNQDGAGPYSCDVSADGGQTFVAATMGQNVPGKDLPIIGSLSGTTAKDFTITAVAPPNTQCKGGPNADACLVRCRNNAAAGPFGGCAAVTNAGAAGTAAPAAAASPAAAAPAAAASPTTAAAASPAAAAAPAKANKTGGLLGGLFGRRAPANTHKRRAIKSRVVQRDMGYWI